MHCKQCGVVNANWVERPQAKHRAAGCAVAPAPCKPTRRAIFEARGCQSGCSLFVFTSNARALQLNKPRRANTCWRPPSRAKPHGPRSAAGVACQRQRRVQQRAPQAGPLRCRALLGQRFIIAAQCQVDHILLLCLPLCLLLACRLVPLRCGHVVLQRLRPRPWLNCMGSRRCFPLPLLWWCLACTGSGLRLWWGCTPCWPLFTKGRRRRCSVHPTASRCCRFRRSAAIDSAFGTLIQQLRHSLSQGQPGRCCCRTCRCRRRSST